MITLHCELSKAAPVEWRKGPETLRAGDRVRLRQDGAVCELEIRGLVVADAGEYSCVCGQERTSATLAVRGKDCMWPRAAVAVSEGLGRSLCYAHLHRYLCLSLCLLLSCSTSLSTWLCEAFSDKDQRTRASSLTGVTQMLDYSPLEGPVPARIKK